MYTFKPHAQNATATPVSARVATGRQYRNAAAVVATPGGDRKAGQDRAVVQVFGPKAAVVVDEEVDQSLVSLRPGRRRPAQVAPDESNDAGPQKQRDTEADALA